MMQFQVSTLNFEEIRDIWSQFLWPERKSPIEPVSWINPSGEIDMQMKLGKPTFLGAFDGHGQVIGVVSGFSTSLNDYRSRGLWVHNTMRGGGLGRFLISSIEERALREGHRIVWTMARHSSVGFYKKVDFLVQKKLDQYEYGPHYIMVKGY